MYSTLRFNYYIWTDDITGVTGGGVTGVIYIYNSQPNKWFNSTNSNTIFTTLQILNVSRKILFPSAAIGFNFMCIATSGSQDRRILK